MYLLHRIFHNIYCCCCCCHHPLAFCGILGRSKVNTYLWGKATRRRKEKTRSRKKKTRRLCECSVQGGSDLSYRIPYHRWPPLLFPTMATTPTMAIPHHHNHKSHITDASSVASKGLGMSISRMDRSLQSDAVTTTTTTSTCDKCQSTIKLLGACNFCIDSEQPRKRKFKGKCRVTDDSKRR